MLVKGLINCTIMCDMFHQNPKKNQQDKRDLMRQDDNNNKDNPSIKSDILVQLPAIKGDINSMKTSIEEAFARTFNFFKSNLQKKELVEKNLWDGIRNLICEIKFFKNILHNYSNINSPASPIASKSVVNNSKI